MFQFGGKQFRTTRKGVSVQIGDYGIHLSCSWRIIGFERIIVGSGDVYWAAGDPDQEPPNFRWDIAGANRRDERIDALFSTRQNAPFMVESVTADAFGGAVLFLSDGYGLEFTPHDSLPKEHWRLLDNINDGRPHYVVTGAGIDVIPESEE